MPTVAVIGASNDREKYGNRAVRAHVRQGYTVYPINPNVSTVEGVTAYPSLADVPGRVDRVTLYVPPEVGLTLLEDIASAAPSEFFVNPGAESDALVAKAYELGLQPMLACSIVDIGETPSML